MTAGRTLRRGRVEADELVALARSKSSEQVNYDAVGSTLGGSFPDDFRHDRWRRRLPTVPGAFERAREGLKSWQAHLGAGIDVQPRAVPEPGATVALSVPMGPFTVVAACRIVRVVDEPHRWGFAYGTLPGHPECGEEAFVVEEAGAGPEFTVAAFSRPASSYARLGGPATRWFQRRITRRYLEALARWLAES